MNSVKFYNKSGGEVFCDEANIAFSHSSIYRDDEKYSGKNLLNQDAGSVYHSKRELCPWVEMRFEKPVSLGKIVISNSNKKYYFRAYSILVEVERSQGEGWEEVYDNWQFMKLLECQIKKSHSFTEESERSITLAHLYAVFYCVERLQSLVSKARIIDLRLAEALIREASKVLSADGFGFTHHGINRTFSHFSEAEKSEMVSELVDVMDLLKEKFDLDSFLTSGTLLAQVRDKKLLGHDDDLDICYFSKFTEEKDVLRERSWLLNSLNELGFKVHLASRGTHLQMGMKSGVGLDLFVAFKCGNFVDISPLPRSRILYQDIFPLASACLHNVNVSIPRNAEACLVNNYGSEWRYPDPAWRFDWNQAYSDYMFLLSGEK
ncbi:hypothetical protein [Microbulbifer sp. GL-2]|uniref:hypothetical protein n=1 Tax=Microbulbifer sp. GL-2 TaxID=2591606 RepID=UPI0011625840|nr:hypothetical protein [Microbulbifer sp. GL-2]BBM00390.1 hypothetical protein GL2_04640 [Microbulbifer sp. GL-2]